VVDGRLEAFSDGVFAVAITLLSIDLVVAGPGHGTTLAHQLREAWPNFAAFLVSFFVVGIIWVNHHSLFKNFAKVDRTLLFLNLLLLLFVVTIPFVTSTLAKVPDRQLPLAPSLAAVLYSGVSLAMSVSFALLFNWSVRDPSRLRNPCRANSSIASVPLCGRGARASTWSPSSSGSSRPPSAWR